MITVDNVFIQKERKYSISSTLGRVIARLNKLKKTDIRRDNNDYIVTVADLEFINKLTQEEDYWFKGFVEEILEKETLHGLKSQ